MSDTSEIARIRRASSLGFVLNSAYNSTFTSLCGNEKLHPAEAIVMSIQVCEQIMEHFVIDFSTIEERSKIEEIIILFINYFKILYILVKDYQRVKPERVRSLTRTVRIGDIIAHGRTINDQQSQTWSFQAKYPRDHKCDMSKNDETYKHGFFHIWAQFMYVVLENNAAHVKHVLNVPEGWHVIEEVKLRAFALSEKLKDTLEMYQRKRSANLVPQFIEIYFRLSGGKNKYIIHDV